LGRKKTDSKEKIAQAALACFIKNGVVTTSFKDIAKEAKVHQPLIGYYFKTFEELFAAVVEILLNDLKTSSIQAIASRSDDPYLATLEYAEAPLRWAQTRPEYTSIWTFFYHMASYSDVFRGINNEIRKGGRDRITLLIYQIQESRKLNLRDGCTVSQLAYNVQSQITGTMVMAVTESIDLDEAAKLCREGVKVLIQGAFEDFSESLE